MAEGVLFGFDEATGLAPEPGDGSTASFFAWDIA